MNEETNTRQVAVPSPAGRRDSPLLLVGVLLLAIITILLVLQTLRGANDKIDPATLRTPYQAVLLSNGLVYFGKVDNANSHFLTLTDVYYIQTRATGGQDKTPPSVLVKRGKEWHAPDRMTINLQDIVFIEPVAPDSTVGKLIEESKKTGQ
jgi:hypothetical protein